MDEHIKFWSGVPEKYESNGKVSYWLNEHLHNTEGPAIIHRDGDVTYALTGDKMDRDEWLVEREQFRR